VCCPGWASIPSRPSTPTRPVSSSPAWAGGQPIPAVGRQVLLTRLGQSAARPWLGRRPLLLPGQRPGGPAASSRPAGLDQEDPAWPGLSSKPPFTSSGLERSGWARPALPWPRPEYPLGRPDYSLSGHDSSLLADLAPPGLRFTSFETYYSSSTNSIAWCQSWDASRLGMAHPPLLYAGLGMPLGSDQHTPPLLVSPILRRRIRLMTWRSRRQQLEDEDQGHQVQARWDKPMTMTPSTVPSTVPQ
jgi:hypothetical protein